MDKIAGTKCRQCKKSPKNCMCVEFRLTGRVGQVMVLADQIATEPVRGQEARVWQPRANARCWYAPTYVDGFPVLYMVNVEGWEGKDYEALYCRIEEDIEAGTFNPFNYENVEGCRVPEFHKNTVRRFAFLRRAKKLATV